MTCPSCGAELEDSRITDEARNMLRLLRDLRARLETGTSDPVGSAREDIDAILDRIDGREAGR